MSDLPAHLANYRPRGLAERLSANIGSGAVPFISIQGNRFTAVDGTGNRRNVGNYDQKTGSVTLDVIVADSNPHLSKIYFENAWDPNASEHLPPVCFSDNGEAPSSQAQTPQSLTCVNCPHNRWGSDTSKLSGKPTKACNDVQKIAVLLPEAPEIMFLLRVPPASLKPFGKYVREVASQLPNGMDVDAIVTRLSFAPNVNGILTFAPIKYVEAAEMSRIQAAVEKKEMDVLVGKTDKPYQGPVTAAAAVPASEERRLPPPAPAPVAQSVEKTSETTQNFLGTQPQSAPTEPKKPRGRPKKEAVQEAPATQAPFMAAAPSSAASSSVSTDDDIELPDFLKRPAEPAPPPNKGAAFGMVSSAPEPPNEMQAAIEAALRLPT